MVVSLLAFEETTPSANSWLEAQQRGVLASSRWLETELHSALSRKIRTGRLSVAERDVALHRLRSDLLPGLELLELSRQAFQLAANICLHHELGIRTGDALHLAAAATAKLTLCTFDKPFAAGAMALGYDVELIA